MTYVLSPDFFLNATHADDIFFSMGYHNWWRHYRIYILTLNLKGEFLLEELNSVMGVRSYGC